MLCMYIEYIKKNIYVLHCVSLLFCQLLFFFFTFLFSWHLQRLAYQQIPLPHSTLKQYSPPWTSPSLAYSVVPTTIIITQATKNSSAAILELLATSQYQD